MKNHIIISLLFLSVGLSQQIIHTETYENGNVKSITSHKETRNRIEKVKYVEYYESGQKKYEQTYKDGVLHGKWTYWYENGQKVGEATFMDDELISEKCWDEDGNVCECSEISGEGITQEYNYTSKEPVLTTDAEDLVWRFQMNEGTKLLNQIVKVNGKVTGIDSLLVILNHQVICAPDPSADLVPTIGESITVKGRCIGYDDLLKELRLDHVIQIID